MKKLKSYIKIILLCIAVGSLLTGTGYLYLRRGIKPAEAEASEIPYTFSPPEDRGLLFNLAGNSVFVQLDFSSSRLRLIIGTGDELNPEVYGYRADYEICGSLTVFALLTDDAGGIELENGGETVRYTGVQAAELLARTEDPEWHREITAALICAIAENGLSETTCNKIVAQSETQLTVPECCRWHEYISEMCENAEFIN